MSHPPPQPPRPKPDGPTGPRPRVKPVTVDDITLYSIASVAKMFDCSRQHVYNLITAGELAATSVGTKSAHTRVSATACAAFLARHTRSTPP